MNLYCIYHSFFWDGQQISKNISEKAFPDHLNGFWRLSIFRNFANFLLNLKNVNMLYWQNAPLYKT
jgi:hypothetical protein